MPKAPKYEQIAAELRNRIKDGTYAKNALIPDQVSLASEFDVSRMTVKKALDELAQEGLVYSRRGDGTHVMGDIPLKVEQDSPPSEHQGLIAYYGANRVHSRVISFSIRFPDETLRTHLKLAKNEPVFEILRLREVDGEPYVLEHTFMPQKLMPDLTEDVLYGSIYAYLKKQGLKLSGSYRKIHAVFADSTDVAYLNCKLNDPVLEVVQVAWLADGTPFEYSFSRNRYDARSYDVMDVDNTPGV